MAMWKEDTKVVNALPRDLGPSGHQIVVCRRYARERWDEWQTQWAGTTLQPVVDAIIMSSLQLFL